MFKDFPPYIGLVVGPFHGLSDVGVVLPSFVAYDRKANTLKSSVLVPALTSVVYIWQMNASQFLRVASVGGSSIPIVDNLSWCISLSI